VGLGLLAVLLAAVSVVGVLHAVRLEKRLNGLSAELQVAQNDAEDGQLGAARQELSSVEASLSKVNSTLYTSPDFSILNLIPVAKQNLAAVRSGVRVALQLVGGGQAIFNAAAPFEGPNGHLEVALNGGEVPVDAVSSIQSVLAGVLTDLPASANVHHSRLVISQVRKAQERVYVEAAKRRAQLTSVQEALSLLQELSGGNGDRRYLIAVGNDAEMRGAGGMILSYGILESSKGKMTLAHIGPIDELKLSQPAPNTFPKDFLATYGALQPSLEWRNSTLMSDFTIDAPVMEAMFTQATGKSVDGVIQVDSAGLGAILTGTGPINVDPLGAVTADNVVPLTLNQQYVLFPDRPVREEYLTAVARAAFTELTSGNFPSLRPLGTALLKATADRHIIMHSNDASTEGLITNLRFDGSLPGPGADFAQLTLQNFGGDKMDYYIQSSLTVNGRRPAGSIGRLAITIDVTNTAPPNGKPPYIFGPNTDSQDPPGVYRGAVVLYLPQGAYLSGTQADPTATTPTRGSQNGLTTVNYTIAIPAGGHSQVTLQIEMPPQPSGGGHFSFVPTPRVNATQTAAHLK